MSNNHLQNKELSVDRLVMQPNEKPRNFKNFHSQNELIPTLHHQSAKIKLNNSFMTLYIAILLAYHQ